METVCAVVGCDSKWTEFTDLEFFRVTTNKKLLPQWLKVIELNISPGARICSLHFREEDVMERGGEKRLKQMVVPSYNIVGRTVKEMPDPVEESDDDTDEENLLTVKKKMIDKYNENDIIMKIEKTTPTKPSMVLTLKRPGSNIIHVEYHGNTRSIGTQVCSKTENEVLMKRKLKTLNQRVNRREERVRYLQAVLRMIRKNIEGTDVARKLKQELENFTENFHIDESNFNKKKIKEENFSTDYISDDKMMNDEQFVSDKGSFVEVALSPNLKGHR